jgi:hypothetical protein
LPPGGGLVGTRRWTGIIELRNPVKTRKKETASTAFSRDARPGPWPRLAIPLWGC